MSDVVLFNFFAFIDPLLCITLSPPLILLPSYESQLTPMHACILTNATFTCGPHLPSFTLNSQPVMGPCMPSLNLPSISTTLFTALSHTHLQVVTAQPTSAARPQYPPDTYMVWSIFTCLCCACPCGLMAIMYSIKVNC